jgi:hypothetical protein
MISRRAMIALLALAPTAAVALAHDMAYANLRSVT